MITEAGAETVIKRFADLPRVPEALMYWDGMPMLVLIESAQ
jgi:hypothetical protein